MSVNVLDDFKDRKQRLLNHENWVRGDLLNKDEDRIQRVLKVSKLLGVNRESKQLLADYGSMIKILPSEFDLKKIKKLKYYAKHKLSHPHQVFID